MRYLSLSLLFLSSLAFSSCLDQQPKDSLTEEQVYTSSRSLYLNTVATLYNHIGGNKDSEGLQGTYRGVYDYNTFTTDEAMIPIRGGDWYDGGFWENLYLHRWDASDRSLYDTWKYLYKVIVFSNEGLVMLDKYRSLLTDSEYQNYQAEVRAVRALYYFYLMDMFGNIPLVTTTNENIENAGQTSRPQVFRFILSELQAAIPYLPSGHSNYEGENYGRITQPVAYFLLAKLFLNSEVYADNDWTDQQRPNGTDLQFTVDGKQMNAWQACQTYCEKITNNGFSLSAVYASNFYVHNETSPENIFIIPMDKHLYKNQYQYFFRSRHYAHGDAIGGASENGACATVSTVRAFGYGSDSLDRRFSDNLYADTVRVNNNIVRLENGQPLIYMPLAVEINLTNSPYIKTAGARMAKYEVDRNAYNDGKSPDNDIVLFRYADVLLMQAEAKIRNDQNGSNELNAVRQRSGMPATTATLDHLLTERLLELMWEGWRRNDLIRFDRFHQSYDQRTAPISETDRHTIVFPIPTRALALNRKLRQNPGYREVAQ